MKIIGLTGGIGMGKSTAAAAFRRCGVPVFDADAVVHRLQARGGLALPAIGSSFPGTVRNGLLDRAALRKLVLADRGAMRRLETILHPLVRREQHRFVARARARGLVVLDIPLLFETGGDKNVDHVVVVTAPAALQIIRVKARRAMSDSDIRAMISLQMPNAAKLAKADTVIRTGLSRFHTVRQIRRFIQKEKKVSTSFLKKRSKKLLLIRGGL